MFSEEKATQAAARIVAKAGGQMNYMLLLKFLYLAERKALLLSGTQIIGDRFFTMKNGPILSTTMELITKPGNYVNEHIWISTFETKDYEVHLTKDPGRGALSLFEEETIDEVFEEFKGYLHGNPFDLPNWMHKHLPEVKTIESGRIPLELADIFKADNRSEKEIDERLSHLRELEYINAFI